VKKEKARRRILSNYLAKKGIKYYLDIQKLRGSKLEWLSVQQVILLDICFGFFPIRDHDPESIELVK